MTLYPLSEYDKHFALKVNVGMLVLSAFLLRPFWVAILALMVEPHSNAIFGYLYARQSLFYAGLAASLPVLIVLAAWARRHPDANRFARYCWARGGQLLKLSALLGVTVSILSVATFRVIPESQLLQLILCLYALVYAVRSKRLQAIFASYPEPEQPKKDTVANN